MNKVLSKIILMFILLMFFSKVVSAQTANNRIGINYFWFAGLNYERVIGESKSLAVSVNKHDWNYANIHEDITLLKGQFEYRLYNSNNYGFYIAPSLTYRYRADPSISEETELISFGGGWGQDPPKRYSIKLHSIGIALVGGYRSNLIFKKFSVDTSLRIGGFPVNIYKEFNAVIRTEENKIVLSDTVTNEEKQTVSRKLAGEIVLSARISYSF
ncbi:MAG: hypothetical protein KTR26_03370 [Flammeovirgaceae bacterium]|nr:hypothetical protein [Flammeovirgaceae bacterium]